ncbi:hypothetical protein [Streptomyces sp. NPDC001889]
MSDNHTGNFSGRGTDGLAAPAFPDRFARTHRFSLGVPRHFTVSPDGRRVLFVRGTDGADRVSRLWLYESGRERLLADPPALDKTPDGTPGTPHQVVPLSGAGHQVSRRDQVSGLLRLEVDCLKKSLNI